MKKTQIFLFFLLLNLKHLHSQEKIENSIIQEAKIDTIYFSFNNKFDKIDYIKNKISGFNIKVGQQMKYFKVGTNKTKYSTKNLRFKLTSREDLKKIIQNDNPNKKRIFVIVRKNKKNEYYFGDYMFRTVE
jgi:hypothetical protein